MSFIQRELDRLRSALLSSPEGNEHDRLYAAQQALSWSLDPDGFASPYETIMDIRGAPKDCQGGYRQPPSCKSNISQNVT